MRVIGIDPGLRRCGWGIVDSDGSRLRHVASGVCAPDGTEMAARLAALHALLSAVLQEFQPDQAAVERTFVNRDPAASLKLGQARGVALLVPAQHGLQVAEYAPNAIKKTVVGVGHADKRQIGHMVRMQLPGADPATPDAADALAIALCHVFQSRGAGQILLRQAAR